MRRCKGSCLPQQTEGLPPLGLGARGRGPQAPSPISAPKPSFRRFRCSAWLIHDFAPSPMRALVFRSAYSASRNARASAAFAASIKAHCAVSSETLMLQVRCANPPMPHRTSSLSCSGVPVGLFGKPKRSTFRCAPLTLRTAHRTSFSSFSGVPVGLFSEKAIWLFLQNARPPGSLHSPSETPR